MDLEDVEDPAVSVAEVHREEEEVVLEIVVVVVEADLAVAVHPEAEEVDSAVAAREEDAVASEPAQRLSLFRTTASKEFTFLKARMMLLSLRTSTLANQSTTKSV